MDILNLIIRSIVGTPAILIGLIATIGLLLQKKSFSQVLAGGVKTAAGYLIFAGGSGIVVGVLNVLSPVIQAAFGLTAPAADAGGIGYPTFLATWGGYVTIAVAVGFLMNLLLARVTPFKYVYLTGHLMIVGAEVVMCGLLVTYPNIRPSIAIIVTGLLLGIYWTLQPAYMNKHMKNVIKSDDLAYGHTSSLACWLAATLGKFVGKPEESTEDVEVPTALEFLKDTVVSLSLVLGIFFVVVAAIAGPEMVNTFCRRQELYRLCLDPGLHLWRWYLHHPLWRSPDHWRIGARFPRHCQGAGPRRKTGVGLPDCLPLCP